MFLYVCESNIGKSNLYINFNMLNIKIILFIFIISYVNSFDIPFFHLPIRQWMISPQPYQEYAPYGCFSPPDWKNCLAIKRTFTSTTPLYNTFTNLKYQQYMQTSKSDGMYPKFASHARSPYPSNLLQSIYSSKNYKHNVEQPTNSLLLSLPTSNLSTIPNLYKGTATPVSNVSNLDESTTTLEAQSRTSTVTMVNTIEENKLNSIVPTTHTNVYEEFTYSEINVTEVQTNNISLIDKFKEALGKMEREFYRATFAKLTSSVTLQQRQENGISFIQSGLFLEMFLLAISTQADNETKAEIDECIGFNVTDTDRAKILKEVLLDLPKSSTDLIFRWSSRLIVAPAVNITQEFQNGAGSALQLHIDFFNETDTSETRAKILNEKVEQDSNGAIHDTFNADDLSGTVTSVMLTTLYLRGRWRSAPTVLNGTRQFHDDDDNTPNRTVRMIRVNDIMRYADMTDIDAEAIEVFYATPGLSLLILVPRGRSLRNITNYICDVGLHVMTGRMSNMRVAATMPIYTLRMTLLLPNKLQTMGISRLINASDVTSDQLRVSHAIQRIMFWAEAGRNAFKDDGIEWDESPELEVVVDRPYIFFVRWHNMTLMNGNFVL